jgi:hypothetical protein
MLARLRMAVALTGLYLAVGACTPIGNTILPSESLGSSGSGSPASNESSQSPVQAKIGSRVQVGTEQIHVVMKVETWKGSTFIKPEKGNVFVAALVKIQALETTTYNPFWYKVRGPDGFEYQPSIFRGCILDTRLCLDYDPFVDFFTGLTFGASASRTCFLACSTTPGWNRCRMASSVVISRGFFLEF